jgi:arylsulfatase A-like enzyme
MARPDLEAKYEKKRQTLKAAGPQWGKEGSRKVRLQQDHAVYAGMVEAMDQAVGKVLDKLAALGLDEQTIVFFMSDNGGLSTSEGHPTSNVPLRAGKGWLYEGGIREPMIVKWPGVTKPGSVCDTPVTSTDFYPTILEMAGLPARPGQHLDGVSLVPLLKRKTLNQRSLYWHYPHYGNQGGSPGAAIRMGDHKLIEFFEDEHVELYNLREDISEKHDLAAKMPRKAAELREMLHRWQQAVGVKFPTPNPRYKE